MRILVIGSGAREHAIVKALLADGAHDIICAPGNAGIARDVTVREVGVTDSAAIIEIAKEQGSDLVVVGPEVPLVAGVADDLRAAGFNVFGPSKAAAQIEGSKAFAKDVMAAAGVATARAESLQPGASDAEIDEALSHFGPTYVVKDDGLAAGKGVVVTPDLAAARAHVTSVLESGNPVLLESFLDGPEVSLFSLVDGETVVPLIPAQDHKRAFDGDEGPNTGGMGAYAPLPWLPEGGVERIVKEVCEPVAREMVRRGTPYSGLLYAGLAWGKEGPAVVEFNCRFGDPETQAVLALADFSLADALFATATGTLTDLPPLSWRDGNALVVVYAAEGYPGAVTNGQVISGSIADGVLHAGTSTNADGEIVAAGGRVLGVIGTGADLAAARDQAYARIKDIDFPHGFYRMDIALPAVEGTITT